MRLGIWGLALFLTPVVTACGEDGGTPASNGFGGSQSGGASSGGATGSGGASGGQSNTGGSGIVFDGGADAAAAVDVDVVITADNAYSFGYGDANGIVHFTQGSRAQTAGQIFNCGEGPEAYLVPAADAPASAYLYIVTWDDLAVTQGVLGQFRRAAATPLYTGAPEFEVCATGVDMQASQTGPAQADINTQIAMCNSGSGSPATTSKGWVNAAGPVTPGAIGSLASGETNAAPGGSFPPVCVTGTAPAGAASIDAEAAWMWYQPGGVANPFQSTGSNTFRAYLIFRVAAADIQSPR